MSGELRFESRHSGPRCCAPAHPALPYCLLAVDCLSFPKLEHTRTGAWKAPSMKRLPSAVSGAGGRGVR